MSAFTQKYSFHAITNRKHLVLIERDNIGQNTHRALYDRVKSKPSASVQKWKRQHGFVKYYTLDNEAVQIAPYGKVGPFPTVADLEAATARVRRRFPGCKVIRRECFLDEDLVDDAELDLEFAKALNKLSAMGA